MKKSFGLARVFFIGVLAVGLFGLLSFAFAGTVGVNPGHPGSEICDGFFCVADDGNVGIGTPFPDTLLTLAINSYTNSDDFIRLIGAASQTNLFFTKENYGSQDGSWVIRTDEDALNDNGLPLKIGTTSWGPPKRLDLELSNDLIFRDGTRQSTSAPGNCNVVIGAWTASSITTGTCSIGTRTGGGCEREVNAWGTSSYPSGNNGWTCGGGYANNKVRSYVVCCS